MKNGPALPTPRALALLATLALSGTAADGREPPPLPEAADRARHIAAEGLRLPGPRTSHEEYDVLHYDVDLDFDIPAAVLTGTVTMEAAAQVPDLGQIEVDLYACMTVDAVTAGGSPAAYAHNGDLLTITLDEVYQVGEVFSVACTYHGTPAFPGNPLPFRWLSHAGVPMVLSYSEPYGSPAWWMCKDDPKDKATYDIHLTVPDTLVAVSNGLLTASVDNGNGTRTYHWTTQYPMSSYLFSIAVTNYASWTEVYTALDGVTTMDVDYYAYPEDLADAQESWSRNVEMMGFFAGLFGEYPFLDEKYGIAEFAHPGAMEHQTCTSMGAGWVNGYHTYDWILAHELSHSWVGDCITMTEWSHAWCKEGFATLCEALYFEDLYGLPYYHAYMRAMPVMTYAALQLYGINPPMHAAIYYKGAWVLHMLRHVIGDQAFFDAVYAYANDPEFVYGVADTDDMCRVFSQVAGLDLTWFFDEWIYNPGYPMYAVGWRTVPAAGGYDITVSITQTQSTGPVFKMPIDVHIVTDEAEYTFVAWDSLSTQEFTFNVAGHPQTWEIDPDHWILRSVMVTEVAESMGADGLRLSYCHPNPCRAVTEVDFYLAQAGDISCDVHDVAGRRVRQLLTGRRPAGPGRVAWDGSAAGNRPAAPGIYYLRFRSGEEIQARRLLLIR